MCEFTLEDQMKYLETVKEAGVSNIDMECTAIASLCHQMKVKCAVVCVALVDRLQKDQVIGLTSWQSFILAREGGKMDQGGCMYVREAPYYVFYRHRTAS